MSQHHYFATCPKGLEYLLRDELIALGASDVREALAGAQFSGPLEIAYRACLWSRLASRMLLPLAEFDAADRRRAVRRRAGDRLVAAPGRARQLRGRRGHRGEQLTHSQYVGLRTKDAVVDQFRERDGTAPEHRHRRARRAHQPAPAPRPRHRRRSIWPARRCTGAAGAQGQGEAPLKENLAAAMLLRAGWPEVYAAGGALLDPMCGSGTLLIEGALMAADVAPGLRREYFGFLGWRGHDARCGSDLLDEAHARAEAGLRALRRVFFGCDSDPRVISAAKRNAQAARRRRLYSRSTGRTLATLPRRRSGSPAAW